MLNFFTSWRQRRASARAARASEQRQRQYEEQQRAEYEFNREQKIAGIRVLTGDIKHRYVIVETLRAFGHYAASPGEPYDPLEATRRATYQLQMQAAEAGADAVIHTRFQILRYAESYNRHMPSLPVYEVHAFGTAVRVVGPPVDWDSESDSAEPGTRAGDESF